MSSASEESDEGGDAVQRGASPEDSSRRRIQDLDGANTEEESMFDPLSHDESNSRGHGSSSSPKFEPLAEMQSSPPVANGGRRAHASRHDYGSPKGSLLSPDETPSLQDSLPSSPGSSAFAAHPPRSHLSPTPSLQPFDRRFKARLSSPLNSPRAVSPAFLATHSRQSSVSSQLLHVAGDEEPSSAPWEVVRWTKLRKITAHVFSEAGRRSFGKPTCLSASANICLGTSKGIILVFDYHQNLKSVIGPGTQATEAGEITSLAASADHTTIAGGHSNGTIFTWDLARPAKPFLHISPLSARDLQSRKGDSHVSGTPILHLGFLGTRHTALASADSRGMAFSHLATRGLGAVARQVKTTRVLGRYPEAVTESKPRKPSTVMAFSPLPLGNAEKATDTMGLVAMLTPYLLVIVSTTPIPQTQHKAGRPKELRAHSALSGCMAWFPAVKLKAKDADISEGTSQPKLVYCWSNILTILDVHEAEPSEPAERDRPPSLNFRPRSRWKAEESIVAIQWLTRSVLAVLTITQQLIVLEDSTLRVTERFDLLQKHIYHHDSFSSQLQNLVEQLDEEDPSLHGVVADAFYASFRAYKGRMFLLGYNDLQVGTLSNWADRLVALMEESNFIGAIDLATSFYNEEVDRLTVGLPNDDSLRHSLVEGKLQEMMSASLRFALGPNNKAKADGQKLQLQELANASFVACISIGNFDFLFEDVYDGYAEASASGIFFEKLEPYILDLQIRSIPPTVLKDLVTHFTSQGLESSLEEMICHLDVTTMDLDRVTTLCKEHNLYDALIYVWNQAIGDYTTPLIDLLSLVRPQTDTEGRSFDQGKEQSGDLVNALKIFPYLSYTLTGRIYPTGDGMVEERASQAKAEIYFFIFSGKTVTWPKQGGKPFLTRSGGEEPPFPYLRLILELDAPSFLSVLNEAFEDSYLNGSNDRMVNGGTKDDMNDEQIFGLSINRQYIVSILLEIMNPKDFSSDDNIYLDMFIARNLPKFPQFILLSGTSLHRILVGLCNFPSDDIADDCQLSVEYLLSLYHPSDIESLIPLFTKARFYRVLKSIYKADKQYAKLLETCFDDHSNQEAVFECIADCLRPRAGLPSKQRQDVRSVIGSHARELTEMDIRRTAEIINLRAFDLHGTILAAIEADRHSQFEYLRTFMEPELDAGENQLSKGPSASEFIERYVQLMCEFNVDHVAEFVSLLPTSDIRLEEVIPAMETGGAIDAAVVLLARKGHVQDAMERLTKHLKALEAAFMGLLGGAASQSFPSGIEDAAYETLEAIEKYTRVGTWLCQQQTKSMGASQGRQKQLQARARSSASQELLAEEQLWLELINTVVDVSRNISAELRAGSTSVKETEEAASSQGATSPAPSSADTSPMGTLPFSSEKMTLSLRSNVQQTFTALLAATATTSPSSQDAKARRHPKAATGSDHRSPHRPQPNLSFLRILTAFLTHASLSSPSLSDLRAVLASIFSAYAYEESLLALSNRLLEKDLFVHVEDATERRQHGWRPLGQVCEGCRRRVWGPGAGAGVWEAWSRRTAMEDGRHRGRQRTTRVSGGLDRTEDGGTSLDRGKGRETPSRSHDRGAPDEEGRLDGSSAGPNEASEGLSTTPATKDQDATDLGPLIVFSCRHIFHRVCLEKLLRAKDEEGGEEGADDKGRAGDEPSYRCVICP